MFCLIPFEITLIALNSFFLTLGLSVFSVLLRSYGQYVLVFFWRKANITTVHIVHRSVKVLKRTRYPKLEISSLREAAKKVLFLEGRQLRGG